MDMYDYEYDEIGRKFACELARDIVSQNVTVKSAIFVIESFVTATNLDIANSAWQGECEAWVEYLSEQVKSIDPNGESTHAPLMAHQLSVHYLRKYAVHTSDCI